VNPQTPTAQPTASSQSDAPPQRVTLEGIPKVQISGVPTFRQFLTSLILIAGVIITTLGGGGRWYLNKSLDVLESKLTTGITKAINDAVGPINEKQIALSEKQAALKVMVSFLVAKNKDLTAREIDAFNINLSKISLEDVKSLFKPTPGHPERRSLNQLIRNKQLAQVGPTVTGLLWDGNHPAQVRYIKRTDPNLDLSKTELYSDPPDPCSSKILQLPDISNATVQVCEAHLDKDRRLEFIIITNSGPPSVNVVSRLTDHSVDRAQRSSRLMSVAQKY